MKTNNKIVKKKREYVHNKNPKFIPKNKNLQKNKFILDIIKISKKIDITKSIVNFTTLPIDPITGNILSRFRKLNKHRELAMQSIVQGMLYYYDSNTNKIKVSIRKLADECGLSTISSSKNKSITRASRLISEFMEPMGFVRCKKIKNRNNVCLKEILLTPLFFMLFDPLILPYAEHKKPKKQNIEIK